MILGCDIGTSVTKSVLLVDGDLKLVSKIPTRADPNRALQLILKELLEKEGVRKADLRRIVVTGWGREKVSFSCSKHSTMNCLARSAICHLPSCRTVLCLGAQESLVMSVNEKGRVLEYGMNDKCASGAGRFLEIIFDALEITVEESAEIARASDRKLTMGNQCAVFAESEVVCLVNEGESVANIIRAIFQSLARNVAALTKRIRTRDDFVISGGIAANGLIVALLEDILGRRLHVFSPQPDFMAAIGAALIGSEAP